MPDEFLKVDELARRLRVSTATIHRLRKSRALPAHQWGSRTVRFEWGEIEAWLVQQRGEEN